MYNKYKVIEYAKKYAFEYNKDYSDFTLWGGDCMNFVSQCLHAGGVNMEYSNYGWYYKDINNLSSSWISVENFWNYAINSPNFKLKEIKMQDLEAGDIVQFYNREKNKYYHCVIVTKVLKPIKRQNIFVASHDNNAFNKSLALYSEINFRFGKILR